MPIQTSLRRGAIVVLSLALVICAAALYIDWVRSTRAAAYRQVLQFREALRLGSTRADVDRAFESRKYDRLELHRGDGDL
jgi:hypothetical protein